MSSVRVTETVKSVLFEPQLRFFDRLFITGRLAGRGQQHFRHCHHRAGLGGVRDQGDRTRLRGSAGTGFRAPPFNDLFFPDFGNPNLQPERSQSRGTRGRPEPLAGPGPAQAHLLPTHFTDLITCCVAIPTAPFGGPVNVGRARTRASSSSAERTCCRTWWRSFTYTYTDSENLATGRPMPRGPATPARRPHLGAAARLSLFTQVYVVSEQFDSFGEVYNSGHTRVDAGGA